MSEPKLHNGGYLDRSLPDSYMDALKTVTWVDLSKLNDIDLYLLAHTIGQFYDKIWKTRNNVQLK